MCVVTESVVKFMHMVLPCKLLGLQLHEFIKLNLSVSRTSKSVYCSSYLRESYKYVGITFKMFKQYHFDETGIEILLWI